MKNILALILSCVCFLASFNLEAVKNNRRDRARDAEKNLITYLNGKHGVSKNRAKKFLRKFKNKTLQRRKTTYTCYNLSSKVSSAAAFVFFIFNSVQKISRLGHTLEFSSDFNEDVSFFEDGFELGNITEEILGAEEVETKLELDLDLDLDKNLYSRCWTTLGKIYCECS